MRALIITDVHANAAALEAVLQTEEAQNCDRVYSLGDQINFGPEPQKTLRLLREAEAVCLLGNHEERMHHLNDAEFAGYNWSLLHWTRAQTPHEPYRLPVDVRLGPVLLTHAVPGDPWHLMHRPDVPAVLDELPADIRYLISGHNHTCWHVEHGGRIALNPGSLGLLELEGAGCEAPFATLEISGDDVELRTYRIPYDLNRTALAYLENGSAQAAPELCRAVLTVMRIGTPMFVTGLMRHVSAVAQQHSLTLADKASWQLADATAPWAEPCTTEEYWKKLERDLHG